MVMSSLVKIMFQTVDTISAGANFKLVLAHKWLTILSMEFTIGFIVNIHAKSAMNINRPIIDLWF